MRLAEAVRRACADAAEGAYEDAGMRGLCAEGRWEMALQAILRVDLARVVREVADRVEPAPADAPPDAARP